MGGVTAADHGQCAGRTRGGSVDRDRDRPGGGGVAGGVLDDGLELVRALCECAELAVCEVSAAMFGQATRRV